MPDQKRGQGLVNRLQGLIDELPSGANSDYRNRMQYLLGDLTNLVEEHKKLKLHAEQLEETIAGRNDPDPDEDEELSDPERD